MPAKVRRYDKRLGAFTRRGRGSPQVGPRCHTCGGFGMWVEQRDAGQEPLVRICGDCPAFYTKGKRP
jgi:hypothetical protein